MALNDKILKKINEKAKGDEKLQLALGRLLKACDEGKQLKRVINSIISETNFKL